MLVITVGGPIIVASLIGIISGAFDDKVAELRKGRSRVLETDHTLILGWSNKVHSIISELAVANESAGKASVVILAQQDKVEMEDSIRESCPQLGKTKVICRNGDPKSLSGLALGSPPWARSNVLLAPEGSPDPNSEVSKTALDALNLASFDHIILSADTETYEPERADNRTLVTLLHLCGLGNH